jgi:DNA modification methylase
LDYWDTYEDYLSWAKTWLDEIYRVLTDTGNCVIFGGFQFQDLKKGDLLEVLHYARHNTKLRFVKALSYEGSIVLDFFAGSGTTGRVCIEENRHSIMVDADMSLNAYFKKHIDNMGTNFFQKPYQIIQDMEIKELLIQMNGQSKVIEMSDLSEDYQDEKTVIPKTPTIRKEKAVAYAVANNDIYKQEV